MPNISSIITYPLSLFNIGLYRINKIVPEPQIDPTDHNTMLYSDNVYKQQTGVIKYLTLERMQGYREVISLLPHLNYDYAHKSICDVGCGTGELLNEIKKLDLHTCLYGYDWSPEGIKWAKRKYSGIWFNVSDLRKITGEYHVIFCTATLEHIIDADIAINHLLKHCIDYLVISVPNGRKDTYQGHLNFWSPESWNYFLSQFDKSYISGNLRSYGEQYGILKGNFLRK